MAGRALFHLAPPSPPPHPTEKGGNWELVCSWIVASLFPRTHLSFIVLPVFGPLYFYRWENTRGSSGDFSRVSITSFTHWKHSKVRFWGQGNPTVCAETQKRMVWGALSGECHGNAIRWFPPTPGASFDFVSPPLELWFSLVSWLISMELR